MSDAEIIRAVGVTKRFGALAAVDSVDYVLHENEIAGIIGSNGAGKTTFFSLLTGYFPPDAGRILYRGRDITRANARERVELGLMRTFQLTATFENLSVVDNLVLAFFRAHRSSSLLDLLLNTRRRFRNNEKILHTLEAFDLQDVPEVETRHLSLGEKRRLEIAMAVIAEPKVLMLDEPLAGLAESEIKAVLDVLRRRAGKQTILIVEHKISHVEGFVERLTVMHEGKIIADGGYDECLRDPAVRRSYWQIGLDTEESPSAAR
jgi:ABC-type branched-subunit amino acid transport system ATPase component